MVTVASSHGQRQGGQRDYFVEVESARHLIEQMLFAKGDIPRLGFEIWVADYHCEWSASVSPCCAKGDMAAASRRAWGIVHRYLGEPAILNFFIDGARHAYNQMIDALEGINDFSQRVEEIRRLSVDMEMALENNDRQRAFKMARCVHAASMGLLHSQEVCDFLESQRQKQQDSDRAVREAERQKRLDEKRKADRERTAACKGPTGSKDTRGPGHHSKRAANDPKRKRF